MEIDVNALQLLPEAESEASMKPRPTGCLKPTCILTKSPGTTIVG
jgi:hypothetical protein